MCVCVCVLFVRPSRTNVFQIILVWLTFEHMLLNSNLTAFSVCKDFCVQSFIFDKWQPYVLSRFSMAFSICFTISFRFIVVFIKTNFDNLSVIGSVNVTCVCVLPLRVCVVHSFFVSLLLRCVSTIWIIMLWMVFFSFLFSALFPIFVYFMITPIVGLFSLFWVRVRHAFLSLENLKQNVDS